VIGDTVNLAARIMGEACHDEERKIMISEDTMKLIERKLPSIFFKKKKFKGKSMELPIFLPLDLTDE